MLKLMVKGEADRRVNQKMDNMLSFFTSGIYFQT